jgi:hypothetical protein
MLVFFWKTLFKISIMLVVAFYNDLMINGSKDYFDFSQA